MNTLSESEQVSTNEESKSVKDDLQDQLNLRAARFSTALLQEELDEKVLMKGLKFELVRMYLVCIVQNFLMHSSG